MRHDFSINCLTGDIINFYATKRMSNLYTDQIDPNTINFEVFLNEQKENTSNIIITDGIIVETDCAKYSVDPAGNKHLFIGKKIGVENATYLVKVNYVKVAAAYLTNKVNIYMSDISQVDTIYGQVPRDIYFW